jgi:hypothetical protein
LEHLFQPRCITPGPLVLLNWLHANRVFHGIKYIFYKQNGVKK